MLSKGIIESIEGNIVVVEMDLNNFIELPIILFPEGVKEGDYIEISTVINRVKTDEIREKNKNLLDEILRKNK